MKVGSGCYVKRGRLESWGRNRKEQLHSLAMMNGHHLNSLVLYSNGLVYFFIHNSSTLTSHFSKYKSLYLQVNASIPQA